MIRIRRRRYVISRLQVCLLLTIASYGLLAVLAVGGLVFLPVALDMVDPDLSDAQRAKASAVFLGMDMQLWPAIAAILIVVGSHAVVLTHRIVGPLYRMCQVMGAATQGDYTVLARIRKKDLLHAEADVLNDLLRSVGSRWETVREDTAQLRDILQRSSGGTCASAPDGVLGELAECLDKLEGHLEGPQEPTLEQVGGEASGEPRSALPAVRGSSEVAVRRDAP